MKVLLIYISPNKTTRRITRELMNLMIQDGHEVTELNIGLGPNRDYQNIDVNRFPGTDLVGIGSPVYHMRLLDPLQACLENLLPQMAAKNPKLRSFIYLTYGGITTGKAFYNTATLLKKNGIPIIGGFKVQAPHFWDVAGYPDETAVRTVGAFHQEMKRKNFTAMDWSKVRQTFSVRKPIVKILYPFTEFIGKKRELPIKILTEKCSRCQKCIRECPAGALEMADTARRDASKCIYCYHCTTLCPKGAIICDTAKIEGMVRFNKKIVGMEKPQNQVFQ